MLAALVIAGLPWFHAPGPPPPLTRVATPVRAVALTFDSGPDARATPAIVDLLQRSGTRATFFVLGEGIEENPALILELKAAGEEVENRGFRRVDYGRMTPRQAMREIQDTSEEIEDLTGQAVHFFRPPTATLSQPLRTYLSAPRLQPVLWSVDARGAGALAALARVRPGDIVRFEEDAGAPRATLAQLRFILPRLRAQHIACVTLRQLVKTAQPRADRTAALISHGISHTRAPAASSAARLDSSVPRPRSMMAPA